MVLGGLTLVFSEITMLDLCSDLTNINIYNTIIYFPQEDQLSLIY